jgi:hypothetical protein
MTGVLEIKVICMIILFFELEFELMYPFLLTHIINATIKYDEK